MNITTEMLKRYLINTKWNCITETLYNSSCGVRINLKCFDKAIVILSEYERRNAQDINFNILGISRLLTENEIKSLQQDKRESFELMSKMI